MKIAIISGSHRPNSQSGRVAAIVESRLKQYNVETFLFNLAGNPLPFWDEGVWDDAPEWQKIWKPISDQLKTCDGFVIISPEWSGMVPSGLKNFFLLCGKGELRHKPGYIIAVSSGTGGAYPVAELRMSSYKNTRICYIPEHLIVRQVESFLVDAANPTERDQKPLARLDYGIKLLLEYAWQMRPIAAAVAAEEKQFPNGM